MFQISKKNNSYKIKINSLNDLFVLSQILNTKNKIFGSDNRKVKIGNKQITKTFFFEIEILKVNFENEVLKVSGKILNENEFIQIGQHHTINYSVNDTIKFERKKFLNFEKNIFQKSLLSKKDLNLLILFDKDILIIFEFSQNNYKFLFEKNNLGSKKNYIEINEEEEKYNLIKNYLKKDYSNIFFVSNFNYNSKLKKYCNMEKIKILNHKQIDKSEIENIINSINLSDYEINNEKKIVDLFLENLGKNKKYSIGENEIEISKIEILILTTKFFDNKKNENYKKFYNFLEKIEKQNKKIMIVKSKNKSGKIIEGFGGIVSINLF